MWAAGWVHGTCDADPPPNHEIFTKDKAGRVATVGQTAAPSVLQRRVAGAQAQAGPSAPVINNHFTIPDTLLHAIHPAAAAAPPAAPAAAPVDPAQVPLLPPNKTVGKSQLITEFCMDYDLGESIPGKLVEHGYRKTDGFRFILVKDLLSIRFLQGEIVELRDAVEKWAVPKPA
ncbi:hypothetical protein B0H16DRAFT_1746526 [Mycena metata]|uniref:Uncharacterized protein n=1 Tax=Mycena metata TaxID=1033252 RepID=A0AAD7GXG9_9AGAR|nr:hypothetical protein B0H16DRAFT_1746526 [Mycena metata]